MKIKPNFTETITRMVWKVQSESDPYKTYEVSYYPKDGKWKCTCLGHLTHHGQDCKHIQFVKQVGDY